MKAKQEFIHSWYLLLISFCCLIFLLLSPYLYANIALVLFLHFLCFKNGMQLSMFFKHCVVALLFAAMMGGFTLIWGNQQQALSLGLRLFLLILASMASGRILNYTKVVLFLVIHKGLKVLWGYPIMIALNSILLFKEEYEKIKLNGKLRGLSFFEKIGMLFPLLVFAIRHSQRGSLSLVTRGLNPSKSFYFSYETSARDRKIFWTFFLVYLCLCGGLLAFHFNIG